MGGGAVDMVVDTGDVDVDMVVDHLVDTDVDTGDTAATVDK